MKLPKGETLASIAQLIEADYIGSPDFSVTGINEIHVVEHGDLVFVDHPKYYKKALESNATTILIDKKLDCPEGKALLICTDPFAAFNKLINHFAGFKPSSRSKSTSAQIHSSTIIQPNVFIGHNVKIGSNCLIHASCSILDGTQIGNNVIIQAGAVLGSDAFYYKTRPTHFEKLRSCGNVVIENDVEIGAGCTIDRGVTGSTIIGLGSKLDNQVHIGHDTLIGKKCLFAAQVGVSGAVVIENNVTLWGQVGVRSDVVIGENAVVLGQSGITKSIKGNTVYFGSPAEESRKKLKELAALRKLPARLVNLDK